MLPLILQSALGVKFRPKIKEDTLSLFSLPQVILKVTDKYALIRNTEIKITKKNYFGALDPLGKI